MSFDGGPVNRASVCPVVNGTNQRRRLWDHVAFTALTARVGETRASCEGVGKEGRKQRAGTQPTGVAVAVGATPGDQPQQKAGTVPRVYAQF